MKVYFLAKKKPHQKLKKGLSNAVFGGEKGIRTPGTVVTVHMISNHAPSASSDISPNNNLYYIKTNQKNQVFLKNYVVQGDVTRDYYENTLIIIKPDKFYIIKITGGKVICIKLINQYIVSRYSEKIS